MYIPLKPLFSKHKGGGVQFTDEPTGNLDSKTSDEVMSILKSMSKKYSQTLVMITHDDSIAQMADRVIFIEDGRVSKVGDKND
ncbi:hypothetical protein KWW18_00105 [Clostridioides difficile]|nr:hypothetical protein [Clostridioides difficile]MBY1244896.1 hypothetical protein [Clostridioides difficile]HBG1268464.1 hypothetical protein [Clostridioides difficile]